MLALWEACLSSYRPDVFWGWRWWMVGHLPYFENCTVDASIL